jgi:Family of unknown function (DUF5677)
MLKPLFQFLSRMIGKVSAALGKGVGRSSPSHEEVFLAGNQGKEPSADYFRALFVFDNVVRECIAVSRQYGGIQAPSTRHFYASVLFTALLSRSISLIILAPHSPWAQKLIEHWDYASAAIIVRTMIELRAAFHYLCVDQTSDEEGHCRWNLLCLHDCCARLKTLEAKPSAPEDVADLESMAEGYRERLRANRHFVTLRHQQRLLNGGSAYLYPIEDILERAGLQRSTYKFLNVVFSSHVHGLPMSYFRMAEEERGRGLPSPIEESNTTICLSLASVLLTATRDEVHEIFKGLSKEQAPQT